MVKPISNWNVFQHDTDFLINRNDWETFEPHSNVLWLHYLADKMLKKKKYAAKDKDTETKLRRFLRQARKCSSATEIVEDFFHWEQRPLIRSVQGLPHQFNSMEGEKSGFVRHHYIAFPLGVRWLKVAEAFLEYNIDNGCSLFRM